LDKSLARRTYKKTLSICLWFSKIAWNIPFVSYFMQKIVEQDKIISLKQNKGEFD